MINRIRLAEAAELATTSPKTKRRRRGLAPSTCKKYIVAQNRLIEMFGPERDVTTITPGELWDWSESLTIKYPNPITANSYRRDVRAMWNHLKKAGIAVCSTDDAFEMEKTTKRIKAISDTNYWRIMAGGGLQDTAMAAILAQSGMRRDALRGMLKSKTEFWQYSDGLAMATVVQEKGGKYEIKFGLNLAASLLNIWLDVRGQFLAALGVADHDYIWIATDSGGPMSYGNIQAVFDRLKKRGHVPTHEPANPHSFRHHFAQKRAIAGMPLPVLSSMLGHAQISTTEIYLNIEEDRIRDAFFAKVHQPDYNLP